MHQARELFGPDGEHPLSMSVLRLLRVLPPESAKRLAREWSALFGRDHAPLFPGLVEYVDYAKGVLDRRGLLSKSVRKAVRGIEERIQFAESVAILQPSGGERFGSLRLYSGNTEDGTTLLALLNENGEGSDELAIDVGQMASDLASEIPEYYGIKIFDLDAAARIDAQMETRVRTIAPVSERVYRVNLILYVRDRARLFGELRDKQVEELQPLLDGPEAMRLCQSRLVDGCGGRGLSLGLDDMRTWPGIREHFGPSYTEAQNWRICTRRL
jgi:hypothetical protein